MGFECYWPVNNSCQRIMQEYEAIVKLKGVELEFVEARTAVIVGPGTDRQRIAQLRRGRICQSGELLNGLVFRISCKPTVRCLFPRWKTME